MSDANGSAEVSASTRPPIWLVALAHLSLFGRWYASIRGPALWGALTIVVLAYVYGTGNWNGGANGPKRCLLHDGLEHCIETKNVSLEDLSTLIRWDSAARVRRLSSCFDPGTPRCAPPTWLAPYVREPAQPLPVDGEAVLIVGETEAILASESRAPEWRGTYRSGRFEISMLPESIGVHRLGIPFARVASLPTARSSFWTAIPAAWASALLFFYMASLYVLTVVRGLGHRLPARVAEGVLPLLLQVLGGCLFLYAGIAAFLAAHNDWYWAFYVPRIKLLFNPEAQSFLGYTYWDTALLLWLSGTTLWGIGEGLRALSPFAHLSPESLGLHRTAKDGHSEPLNRSNHLTVADYHLLKQMIQLDFANILTENGFQPRAKLEFLGASELAAKVLAEADSNRDVLVDLLEGESVVRLQTRSAWTHERATRPEVVLASMARLWDLDLVYLAGSNFQPTLAGLEVASLPNDAFLQDIPLESRKGLMQAERLLREGNARDAVRATGILLEEYLSALIPRLLPPRSHSSRWRANLWPLLEPSLWSEDVLTPPDASNPSTSGYDVGTEEQRLRDSLRSDLEKWSVLKSQARGAPNFWKLFQPAIVNVPPNDVSAAPARSVPRGLEQSRWDAFQKAQADTLFRDNAILRTWTLLGMPLKDAPIVWSDPLQPSEWSKGRTHALARKLFSSFCSDQLNDGTARDAAWEQWHRDIRDWLRGALTLSPKLELALLLLEGWSVDKEDYAAQAKTLAAAVQNTDDWEFMTAESEKLRDERDPDRVSDVPADPTPTRPSDVAVASHVSRPIKNSRNTYLHARDGASPQRAARDAWHLIHLVRVFISMSEQVARQE